MTEQANPRILWEVAKSRLIEAGYLVYKVRARLEVRKGRYETPTKLNILLGKVSEKSTNSLIRKIKESKE